ncbi:5-oxoprolinase/urea amidolyase family protein [Pseudomonas jessenii]|uniref:5-oxoprolinase subunit B/C family protein n=1 Tax=Pseudomonas jessenii TaxID=77298 RepID=UPI0039E02F84
MLKTLQFLPAGSNRFLIDLDDLDTTIQLFDALSISSIKGIVEIVPGARTLLVTYDPLVTLPRDLYEAISSVTLEDLVERSGVLVEIPVRYDGEDLSYVAEYLGWTVDKVIQRHSEATFTVAFTGFAPGFAYMTCDDPAFEVPRRDSPRTRIPAGSVALAGRFCGIYPSDTPGGWQLLGTTTVPMWDVNRERAALFSPGDRVRFRAITEAEASLVLSNEKCDVAKNTGRLGLKVLSSDRPALFQDLGRPGNAHQGVSQSGAADQEALRDANSLVGNPPTTAAIEITYGGFSLRTDVPITLAVAGAPTPITIFTADGRSLLISNEMPIALDAGETLSLGAPPTGVRTYLALRGGYEVPEVLGSSSTDTLAKIGPAPITAGDVIVPGHGSCSAVNAHPLAIPSLPKGSDTVVLDVIMGPRTDWFTPEAIRTFVEQPWTVTPESSRVGVRLHGLTGLERDNVEELPSEGTSRGSIQVPRNGQPVLFLADHPITGGYPVIAVVADHHLSLAAQLPIGVRVRFNLIANFDPQVKEFDR